MTHRSATGRLLVTALLVLLGSAAGASADPIAISSGTISFLRGDQTRFSLVWMGGSLTALAGDSTNGDDAAAWPAHACNSCTAGASVNPSLSQEWTISASEGPFLDGNFYANGTRYTLKSMVLNINASPVTIPTVPPGENSTYGSTAPSLFTMSGNLIGMANDVNSSLIALTIAGRGNAVVTFTRLGDDLSWFSTEYRFTQAPAATPEPGTVLLLSGGLAAALARRRKARQAAA